MGQTNGPFEWKHVSMKEIIKVTDIAMGKEGAKQKAMNLLRESYRRQAWTRWQGHKRHEAVETKHVKYDEERIRRIKQAQHTEVQFTIMVAGFQCPAWMTGRATPFTDRCPWCKTERGTHDHIVWGCTCRPRKVARPREALQR